MSVDLVELWLGQTRYGPTDPTQWAKSLYVADQLSLEEFERVLDMTILKTGFDAETRCPRCRERVGGLMCGSEAMLAVRCTCGFTGYAELVDE